MMPSRALVLILVITLILVPTRSSGEQKRAVTARDCVTVRDLKHDDSLWRSTLMINPDGSRVAYPVESPDLGTNQNKVELYVRKLPTDPENSGKPILVGDEVSAVRWRPDGRTLTVLIKENGKNVIAQVHSLTGAHDVLIKANKDIVEYSIDSNGGTVVYAMDEPATATASSVTAQDGATGYRIPFQSSAEMSWPQRRLFLVRRTEGGWTAPAAITIRSPLSQQLFTALTHATNSDLQPTLSPDGTKLLFTYWDLSEKMPDEWRTSGYMQHRNRAGIAQAFRLLILYDLATGAVSVPLKTPFVLSAPLWSADSKSFVVVAFPPVGSELERESVKTGLIEHSGGTHLFWVDARSGKIEDVASKLAYPFEGALFWHSSGDLFLRATSLQTIDCYSRINGEWRNVASWALPLQRIGTQLATDGKYVIGDFNDTTTPPQLFVYKPGEKQVDVFAKLNPQFDYLTLAGHEEVHWKTSTGFNASGLLLLPPNYVKGRKYPLVIQTKPFGTFFVCSFGNFPSFAPQPLANGGIMYLGQIATHGSTQVERDYFPKGYPGYQGTGGVAEAAFAMDLWDSAVKALDEQGWVDSNRVGIIGFSRTGWYTEFILTHSKVHYRAATVADNVQYNLGEYWLLHDPNTIKSYDLTYGGPPYGATLKNWMDHSISFNIDKVHTPLLMEQMGYGRPFDNIVAPPVNLASAFEVFTGLNRLNKPVELYYYPNEDHTPGHPKARLATMQRNVDWYRFWLQDYERPNPEDPLQYVRWRRLRELQQKDEKSADMSWTSPSATQ